MAQINSTENGSSEKTGHSDYSDFIEDCLNDLFDAAAVLEVLTSYDGILNNNSLDRTVHIARQKIQTVVKSLDASTRRYALKATSASEA